MKISTHVRAALTAAIVAGIGVLIKQPQMATWIEGHWFLSDLFTATGVAYGVYISYANQQSSSALS